MVNNKLIKEIFDLAKQGIYLNTNNLPDDISKEVIEKNILYVELQNLIRNNGSKERIEEIKTILYPPEEDEEEVM